MLNDIYLTIKLNFVSGNTDLLRHHLFEYDIMNNFILILAGKSSENIFSPC